jgi:hypothetical protein
VCALEDTGRVSGGGREREDTADNLGIVFDPDMGLLVEDAHEMGVMELVVTDVACPGQADRARSPVIDLGLALCLEGVVIEVG